MSEVVGVFFRVDYRGKSWLRLFIEYDQISVTLA